MFGFIFFVKLENSGFFYCVSDSTPDSSILLPDNLNFGLSLV